MSEKKFIWLTSISDVHQVAKALGLDDAWNIEKQRQEDLNNGVFSLYYILDGTRVSVPDGMYQTASREFFEQMFWDDIWDRPVQWRDTFGAVREIDTTYVLFHLETIHDGERISSRQKVLKSSFESVVFGWDVLYKHILDTMVDKIDELIKTRIHGPRDSLYSSNTQQGETNNNG